jgi:hypothetical protein
MRQGIARHARPVAALAGLGALVLLLSACLPSQELLQRLLPSPSDPRATFVPGNETTCAGVNLPDSIQVGASENNPASDANVSGIPAPNTCAVQPGQGEEVNVTITGGPNVVIDAVVVKGGPAYNLYTDPTFLPPTLGPPQHYIAPLNGGDNVPALSHWYICYHLSTPPPVGSLTVRKVVSIDQQPATPLPTSYTALENCNDGIPAHENVTVTLPGGGGIGTPVLTGIPPNTMHGRRAGHGRLPTWHHRGLRPCRRRHPTRRDHRERRRGRGDDHQQLHGRPARDGDAGGLQDAGPARTRRDHPARLLHPGRL